MENKRTLKQLYRTYVKEWKQDHSEPEFQGMEPACFEEWLDWEYEDLRRPWKDIALSDIRKSPQLKRQFRAAFNRAMDEAGEMLLGKVSTDRILSLVEFQGYWSGTQYRIRYNPDTSDGFSIEERW